MPDLVTTGEIAGEVGICLGRAPDTQDLWAVSPNSSEQIVNLRFDDDFGVLINPGQKSSSNGVLRS